MGKIETFDDAIIFNHIDKGKLGIYQSFSQWASLLRDVAVSLYEWHGNISFQDLLLIEEYIFNRQEFALVRCKYKVGKAIVLSDNFHIFQVTTFGEIRQGEPKAVRIVGENLPKNLVRHYTIDNFVYFCNRTFTYPWALTQKYAEMLTKLDALYMQNVQKLSLPIMAINNKSTHNELLNFFKRGELNAVFSMLNPTQMQQKEDVNKIFFNPQIEFILDKINNERSSIMKEFLLELGINTNIPQEGSRQYVNLQATQESSLVARYFSASLNKFRTNFVNKVNTKFPSLQLHFNAYSKDIGVMEVSNSEKDDVVNE